MPLPQHAPNSAPIVHLVPALFARDRGILGGAERYVWELARHMAEVTPTCLVSFGDKASDEQVGKLRVRVFRPWAYLRANRSNPFTLSALRPVYGARAVHCHQKHIVMTSLGALTAKLRRKKIFVTDYGGGGLDISSYVSTDRWFNGELHLSLYSQQLQRSHAARSTVIGGGIDTGKFAASRGPRTKFVFVGRLLPHKGVDTLIRALGPGMSLDVIGQPYDTAYLDLLKKLSEGKVVHFRHDCSDADIVRAYQQAIAVVLPSVYEDCYGHRTPVPELLGQSLLEGMSCGAPGIATRVASLPELLEDGISGWLVPPNDPAALGEKLRQLHENPEQVARLGEAARRRVESHFNWPRVVERCLNFYFEDKA